MTGLAFAVAAGLGAVIRHVVRDRTGGWPGTLIVNVAGALLAGWALAGGLHGAARTVVVTGFAGALTTMSGVALDALDLGDVDRRRAGAYVAVTLAAGLAAAMAGAALA